MKNLFLTSLSFLLVHVLCAQVPQGMSYQSVIRDTSGELVSNDLVGIQISIIHNSIIGPLVYQETHAPLTNVNGLASMEVGSGTPLSGVFADIDWSVGPYFIRSQVDPEGGTNYTLNVITELLAVPYAFHAETSGDSQWSENGAGINTSNNAVGINIEYPQHTLDVRSISQSEASQLNVSNQDRSRYLRFFSGSETYPNPSITWAPGHDMLFATFDDSTLAFSESMRISNSGDIGIGIDDPEARLDIKGGDWNLDAGNPGDLRIGNATNNFRIGVATGGGGAGIARLYTNSNALILGASDAPSLILEADGRIRAPSLSNALIEAGGSGSLVTKAYVDDAIAPSTATKTISLPGTSFRPSRDMPAYRVKGLYATVESDVENGSLYAPISLPVGSVITEVKFYLHDYDVDDDISVYIGRGLGYQPDPTVMVQASTSSNPGNTLLTLSSNIEVLPDSQFIARVGPVLNDTWNSLGNLRVYKLEITYAE